MAAEQVSSLISAQIASLAAKRFTNRAFMLVTDFGAVGDGVTDDTHSIQSALNAARDAGGGTIYVPDGTYLITDILRIFSNTKLILSPNATILRGAHITCMLLSGVENIPGYDGAHDIEVIGGTWDGNKENYKSGVTVMGFGHCKRITIRDLTIKNVYLWHHIEINAVKTCRIINCNFIDFEAPDPREMVQIDLMADPGAWIWYGPIDQTPCDDIIIQGCTFVNGKRGIGSHSTVVGKKHTNVKIIGNHFENFSHEALYLESYDQLVVSNNTFYDCYRGIRIHSVQDCEDFVISQNVLRKFHRGEQSVGITIAGIQGASALKKGVIIGNVVDDIYRHGIAVEFCEDWLVSNNVVSKCGFSGFWTFRSKRVEIVGNNMKDNQMQNSNADIRVGTDVGSNTETLDIVVANNTCSKIKLENTTRAIVTNNIVNNNIEVLANAASIQKTNNFISGTWTP